MSAGTVIGPAVLVNRVDRGLVACVAAAPDAAYAGNYRMPEHRKLIRNLVRFLYPDPLVKITAPPHVETIITEDAQQILVHFLFFAAPPTSATFPSDRRVLPAPMEEPLPYEASVETTAPIRRAFSANGNPDVSIEGGRVRIRACAVHDVIVLEKEPA